MTAFERVESLLKHVTYKPGWTWKLWRERHGVVDFRINLTVTILTDDVLEPAKKVKIDFVRSLDSYNIEGMSDKQIIEYFIGYAFREMEDHEFKEWFQFDGIPVFDPHPEEKEKIDGQPHL